MEKVFTDSVYEIDLMYAKTPADVVFDLSSVLDHDYVKNKKICLKIGNINLNQAQLLSIKSLIQSVNSVLTYMVTPSKQTEQVAIDAGIIISKTGIEELQIQDEKGFVNSQESFPDSIQQKVAIENNQTPTIETYYEPTQTRLYETMEIKDPINYPPEIEQNFHATQQENYEQNSEQNNEQNQEWQEPQQTNHEQNSEQNNDWQENNNQYNEQNQEWQEHQQTENEQNDEQNNEHNNQNEWQEIQQTNEQLNNQEQNQQNNNWQENNNQYNEQNQEWQEPQQTNDEKNNEQNYNEQTDEEKQNENREVNFQSYNSLNEFVEEVRQEEVQEELNNIFDSEKKLEEVFDGAEKTSSEYEYVVEEYTAEDHEIELMETKYVKQTLRSGQSLSFDGNIILIGDAHPGSEIIARGDITVWGILGGIAHAGSKGNSKARIRALKMNAIQLRIANFYARKPDALHNIYVERTNSFTPEEARIKNLEIVIYKMNDHKGEN